jgi:hypothetical protein
MPSTDPDRTGSDQREFDRRNSDDADAAPQSGEPPAPFRLQTAQDVIDLLEEQIEAVRTDVEASALKRAQTIGKLASIALKAIEVGNLAARLEAMEAVLKQRHGGQL